MNIESQLVEKSMDGDLDAFEELVLLFDKKIYNYCLRMTNNYSDAEDLAQEVFLKVYRNLKNFRKDSKFSTWIYRIAYNTCIDNYRKKRLKLLSLSKIDDDQQEIDIPSPEPLPEEQVISSEKYRLIKECIADLKPRYKSAIILRDIQNYSYKEIAEILDIPIGTVKSDINRGRALLRKALKSRLIEYGERRMK
ncbi:MAG: sigma-70 family RNA polymerase sigma factor [Caldicoprobacterales bacterium]|nr:sigma-70 family RNA polymerase sigma factor [Clostridiales bacterium]